MFENNSGEISECSTENNKDFFLISFSVYFVFLEIIDLENKGHFSIKMFIIKINLNQIFIL